MSSGLSLSVGAVAAHSRRREMKLLNAFESSFLVALRSTKRGSTLASKMVVASNTIDGGPITWWRGCSARMRGCLDVQTMEASVEGVVPDVVPKLKMFRPPGT